MRPPLGIGPQKARGSLYRGLGHAAVVVVVVIKVSSTVAMQSVPLMHTSYVHKTTVVGGNEGRAQKFR